MICPKCNTKLIIDEWYGWVWYCFHCHHIDRYATDKEIRELEKWGY